MRAWVALLCHAGRGTTGGRSVVSRDKEVRGVAVGKRNAVSCYRTARFEQPSYRAAQSEEQGTLFCFSALARVPKRSRRNETVSPSALRSPSASRDSRFHVMQ